ncbi:MAG: NusA-like transcription termination signal-binding factor [Nanoarchaeota archaeon]|nr:NusA-like transcription termination signal-binding factor [Nanoarchaeota archaeon]
MQYNLELIGYVTTFENLTRAKVKEAFYDINNILTFIVEPGEIGKAIGKKGSNIKRLAGLLKKRLRVIEYHNDALTFVKNCLLPHIPKSVKQEGDIITIETTDNQQKSALYGREKNNLKNLQLIIHKYFKTTVKLQ